MAFQVSPGVQVSEIDLTNVVPAVSSTTGAFAGQFKWGPVDEVKTVSDSKGLIDEFSSPANTDAGAEDFYSAEAFLKYGSSLRVVRISNLCYSANAAGGANQILKNDASYESTFKGGTQSGTVGDWVARYAGSLGNSVKVSVCASSNAYYNDSVTTVGGTEAVGQTIISVAASNVFNIGDQIQFQGDNNFYRVVTKPDGTSISIVALNQPANTGLLVAQASGSNIDRYWEFHNLFDSAPGISAGQAAVSGTADEMHIVVVDEDGEISGTVNGVLETHGYVSCASNAKDSTGRSNYYKNVIARDSQWVWWSGHKSTIINGSTIDRTHAQSVAAAFLRPTLPVNYSLTAGSDGRSPTAGQKHGAWDTHFSDADTVDISFLICGSTRTDNGSGVDQDTVADHNTIVNNGILLAETRKDCMFICSPRKTSIVDVSSESSQVANVKADFSNVTSSSYAVLDSGWVYSYDRFNDKYCWVPGNGHTAGIMARSDLLRDPWFSPAGFSRGQYLGITKLAFNPKQGSRDDLYRARINPIVTFPGQGTVLFGDKTALTTPSAFDRINVRRLFIVLEKAIAAAAQAQLFEFNDAFTRAQFRSAVEPFLRDVKNRRGLVDFSVICDETNNTDTVIDRNEFVCSIFVKPARSINFITLNFVAARSGVEFSEIYSAV
jgi:phage tail sheath protein FI